MDSETSQKFVWHRPADVPTTVFLDFTSEAESRIGPSNGDLLSNVDAALNGAETFDFLLDAAEEDVSSRADRWVASRAGASDAEREALRRQYMYHLAYIHELIWRRRNGPALFERKSGVTPAPDFLPCTAWQVPARRLGAYRTVGRVWNWASVVTITGFLPMIIIPTAVSEFTDAAGVKYFAFVGAWLVAAFLFLSGYLYCRSLRGR